MAYLSLIQNLALLVALSVVHQLILRKLKPHSNLFRVASGLIFGGVAVVGMMTPLEFTPGIIFDGRSVVLAVSGMFGGPLVAGIAALICGAYRLWLGGGGAVVGVCVIAMSAGLGATYHFFRQRNECLNGLVQTWGFGLLVHVLMLALFLALPDGIGFEVIRKIGLPILVFYPIAVMLLAYLFHNVEDSAIAANRLRASEQELSQLNEELTSTIEEVNSINEELETQYQELAEANQDVLDSHEALRQSGVSLQKAQEIGSIGSWELDTRINELLWSDETYRIFGIQIGTPLTYGLFIECVHPDDREFVDSKWQAAMSKTPYDIEHRLLVNGEVKWVREKADLIFDDNGACISGIGIVQDITERKQAEKALRDSEEQVRLLLDSTEEGVYGLDMDGKCTFCNPACLRILGYSDESDLLGKSIHDLMHHSHIEGQNHEDESCPILIAFRSGVRMHEHNEHLWRKDGTSFPAEYWSHPVYREGEVVGAVVTFMDISERKRAEKALERTQLTVDRSSDAIYWMDLDARFIYVNNAACKGLGYTRNELLSMNVHDIDPGFSVEDWAKFFPPLKQGSTLQLESQHQRIDGSFFHVEIVADYVAFDEEGYVCAFVRDISKRKKAEDELKASIRLIEESQRVGKLGSYVLDVVSGTWTCTAVLDDILGLPPGYRKDTHGWLDLIHPEDAEELQAYLEEHVLGQRQPFDKEYRIISKRDGTLRWVYGRGELMYSPDGELFQMVGTIQDITEQKQAEEERLSMERQMLQAQKLESLGVLAGGIAHDFNNLLMVIMGNADLALDQLSPLAPARSNIAEIEIASKRAAGLAKQMLAYSGKGKLTSDAIGLNEFVEEMSHLLEVSLSKKVVLKFDFADNLPLFQGDATQIRQIIMNLIVNASEAVGDRSGIVSIATGAIDCTREYLDSTHYLGQTGADEPLPEGIYVFLEVADTGSGIDRETLDKIFDPFFTTKFTGRGLGLAATLGIVRGHCGAIKVYSEVGKGSTFKVLLPASATDDGESNEKGLERQEEWHGKGTILLVDDEETIRAVGKQMLLRRGFDVLVACDGREAVEVFRKHQDEIVCVLLDLTMPHLDGNEAFREMRAICPDVKVLLCSGFNEQEATQRFTGKGLAGFIHKPFSMKDLFDKLKEALGG